MVGGPPAGPCWGRASPVLVDVGLRPPLPDGPLARAFVAAGHDVLWAVGADARPHVEACAVPTAAAGLTGGALVEVRQQVFGAAGALPPPERAAYVFPRWFGSGLTGPMVDDLLPLARDWGPDLLVHEQGELAAPLVGAVLAVPSVTTSFGGFVPAEMIAAAGDRLSGLWARHGLDVPAYAGCYGSLYLDICPPSVQAVPGDHVPFVQALRPVAMTGPAPPVPGYLDRDGRALVYVTLGTVRHDAAVLRAAVGALAALPVRVLVTLGPDGDPAALGALPDAVHVERWVHQPLVLEHAAVVVSHGGSGTFLGALNRGLPQLCLPQAADQFRNAAGGVRSGAALALGPDEADEAAIGAAAERLLRDPSYANAAAAVAAEIAAMPSPDEVVDVLVDRYGGAPTIER